MMVSLCNREGTAIPTPPRTSVDAIVAAGRRIVEADGLDRLTMQTVARAVGVRAPSLYKHVQNRDALVRMIVESVARDLTASLDAATTGGDPLTDLRALANALRTFAREHPAGYGLLFAPLPEAARAQPQHLAAASRAVLVTAEALAGPEHALDAARTVTAWAHGFITMELAGAFRLGGDIDSAYTFGIERLGRALAQPR